MIITQAITVSRKEIEAIEGLKFKLKTLANVFGESPVTKLLSIATPEELELNIKASGKLVNLAYLLRLKDDLECTMTIRISPEFLERLCALTGKLVDDANPVAKSILILSSQLELYAKNSIVPARKDFVELNKDFEVTDIEQD